MANAKYFYEGMTLKDYCISNDINYERTLVKISKYKKQKKFETYTIEQIIDYALKNNKELIKFVYKGESLRKYCLDNDIDYAKTISRINRIVKRDNVTVNDDFIKSIIDDFVNKNYRYYYNGLPLTEYCNLNNVNYNTVRSFIGKERKKGTMLSDDELLNSFFSKQKGTLNNTKYYYKGKTLRQYCLDNKIDYGSVRRHVYNKMLLFGGTYNDYIDNALVFIQNGSYKYFYKNEPVKVYCEKNDLIYKNVIRTIYKRLQILDLPQDEVIEMVILEFEKRENFKKINEMFLRLSNDLSEEEIKNICEFLKIDYDNLLFVNSLYNNLKQSINIIWYFGVEKECGFKKVARMELENIKFYLNCLKNTQEKKLEINILLGLYKSDLYDTRLNIIEERESHMKGIRYNYTYLYRLDRSVGLSDEFDSELTMFLLELIEKTNSNISKQIIKYIDVSFRGKMRQIIQNYKRYYLNEIDENRVADTKEIFEEIDPSDYFSKELLETLQNLEVDDIKFISLKYLEDFNDEELCEYYKITALELFEKEQKILTELRNNAEEISILTRIKN